MLLQSFSSIRGQIKINKTVAIDNLAAKLHYRLTTILLIGCTILVTSRQYIGEHIRCIADAVPEHVVNTFCYFTTTYTVAKHNNRTALEQGEIPHLGVGPSLRSDEIIRHAYYQWVPFVLFAQAVMFYLPHLIWKSIEGGRLKILVDGLQMVAVCSHLENDVTVRGKLLPSRNHMDERLQLIKFSFFKHIQYNRYWAVKMLMCEIFYVANMVLQIFVTDRFLGRSFFTLNRDNMDKVFPKMTKCDFYKYGPSGTIQRLDVLCVLAINVINEKVFIILWYWYCFLVIATSIHILWRITSMIFHSRSHVFNKFAFSLVCTERLNPWNMLEVTRHSSYSDWLYLYYLAKNLDSFLFKEVVLQIGAELRSQMIGFEEQGGDVEEAKRLSTLSDLEPLNGNLEENEKNNEKEHLVVPEFVKSEKTE